jgi:thioesterase domain-containing protein
MTARGTMRRRHEADDAFGIAYLQRRLDREFPLARHIGVSVAAAGDAELVLRAPFAPNANHKATAFGGSLFSVAVLVGWAWATRYLEAHGLNAEAVIQQSTIDYLKPVTGDFEARLTAPPAAQLDRFLKMLARSGKGRLCLTAEIRGGHTLAAKFEGWFVATTRA